ncbi:MAG: general stress protein [Naasia sp.]
MSNTSSPLNARRALTPTLPKGETVASYETYFDAQQAVDTLVKADFPVKDVSIVGNDLKSVERVTGKLTWGRAAGAGAISGLWLGVFVGLILMLFSPGAPNILSVAVGAALLGAAFGMLFALGSYAFTRRIRDYTSTQAVIATSYTLVVKPESSARAANILGTAPQL